MTVLIIAGIVILMILGIHAFRRRITKGCCETGDDQKVQIRKIDQNPADYPYAAVVHIRGMHCENCVRKVTAAYAEKGCFAEVSLRHNDAVVHMKNKLSDELLTAIPSRIGYDAWIEQKDNPSENK